MQCLEKRNKNIHFPIMSLPNKAHVSLVGIAQKLQIIRNKGVLHMSKYQIKLEKKKATLRAVSPHHKSCQKLILVPSPTTNLVKVEKESQLFLMFFHAPTPKALAGSREHHPPHKLSYLESTTTLHHASLSIP
jgi:hypothetical protein